MAGRGLAWTRRRSRVGSGERQSYGEVDRANSAGRHPGLGTVPRPLGTSWGPRVGGTSESVAVASPFAAFPALASACAARASAGPRCDDVVDAEHHDRRVRRGRVRLGTDADRLEDVLLLHVRHFAGEDVHPGVLVPLLVLLAEFDEDVDRVESRVLRKGPGNHFHGVREGLDRDLLASADGRREVAQSQGDLRRAAPAARDDLAVLDRDRHDAGRVLEGPLDLIDDVFRPAADQDRDCLRVLAARDEGHLVIADLLLVDELGVAEVVLRELVELRDDLPARGLRQLLHVGLLDPPDGVDFLLREVVLREVVDAFLAEEHVRAALADFEDIAVIATFLRVSRSLTEIFIATFSRTSRALSAAWR